MRLFVAITLISCLGPAGAATVDYAKQVKPIFEAHCASCHGALSQKAKLRLDHGSFIRKGGRNGTPIVPGDAANSLLIQAVLGQGRERMPPEKEGAALSLGQIELLKQWIREGALTTKDEPLPTDPSQHWSFQKPLKQQITNTKGASPNPVDFFIDRAIQSHGLGAGPLADKSTLVRRIYLDLLGVPPTPRELRSFITDESADAYEKLVDRLLMDPRHGERWARHWMDIWRYSDWYGRRNVPDVWNSAPQIWRWRDWIVRSINQDHGYDRMVREMLAGDEIAPNDDNTSVATGYLVRNWYALNPNDWMRNIVEHTGKAFLGLTFNCAHCHDHKYDPIRQEDYFGFRAFFEPIYVRQDRVAGEADPGAFQDYNYSTLRKIQRLGMVRVFDKTPDAPTWFYTGGDERNRVKDHGSVPPHMPAVFTFGAPKIEPVPLPPETISPALRPSIRQTMLQEAKAAIASAEAELARVKSLPLQPTKAQEELLAKASQAYNLASKDPANAIQHGAIQGKHSVLLAGSNGRAIIQNSMKSLSQLVDGSTFRFKLHILEDAKFNMQLSKDSTKGLTATYVGFEKGRIVSYKPKSFTVFDAGHYNFNQGQNLFEVSMIIRMSSDDCLLTVVSLKDDKKLVDNAVVALNGWNPVGDPKKPIFFDVHAQSTVLLDDIQISPPASVNANEKNSIRFDFESPAHQDQKEIIGVDGWEASQYSMKPGYSLLVCRVASPALRKAAEELELAKKEYELPRRRVAAAQGKLQAAKEYFLDMEARLAAEQASYSKPQPANIADLKRKASLLERQARLTGTKATLELAEIAVSDAGWLPEDKRKTALDAANKQLAQAKLEFQKADAASKDPALVETYTPFTNIYPAQSTGRRKALAEWITSTNNPLTARVAVNHVWNWHFHSPLVATVHDFGRNGKAPSHPELLDWLAVEFMESGWSMKHLHRLIVTSNAYKRTSKGNPNSNDPENIWLARMNSGRMETEVIRDSLLACAGKLDYTSGGQELENTEALKTYRRSIYYSIYPDGGGKGVMGDLFDGPDPLDCYRRSRSIVPQQALALTNSQLIHQLSSDVAASIMGGLPTDATQMQFIGSAFELILNRQPTSAERENCNTFLGQTPDDKTRAGLVRVLFNHNDFLSIR